MWEAYPVVILTLIVGRMPHLSHSPSSHISYQIWCTIILCHIILWVCLFYMREMAHIHITLLMHHTGKKIFGLVFRRRGSCDPGCQPYHPSCLEFLCHLAAFNDRVSELLPIFRLLCSFQSLNGLCLEQRSCHITAGFILERAG